MIYCIVVLRETARNVIRLMIIITIGDERVDTSIRRVYRLDVLTRNEQKNMNDTKYM